MPRATTLESLADLAEDQWGLFSRRQAEATGMAWTTLARLARSGAVERVAHGIYRMRGTPVDDDLALRAAWLQLAPGVKVWERTPEQGVVSRRSAASMYGLGHLPAINHQFILPVRRQTRRADVRLYQAGLADDEWIRHGGLLVTRPSRIAADLLEDREDPEAVAHVIADALRDSKDYPGTVARAVAPHAVKFGLDLGDGLQLLEWLLGLTEDPHRVAWLAEGRNALARKDEAAATRRSGK
jgi:Transcriptional regulator, AbiEi antitoxin